HGPWIAAVAEAAALRVRGRGRRALVDHAVAVVVEAVAADLRGGRRVRVTGDRAVLAGRRPVRAHAGHAGRAGRAGAHPVLVHLPVAVVVEPVAHLGRSLGEAHANRLSVLARKRPVRADAELARVARAAGGAPVIDRAVTVVVN